MLDGCFAFGVFFDDSDLGLLITKNTALLADVSSLVPIKETRVSLER